MKWLPKVLNKRSSLNHLLGRVRYGFCKRWCKFMQSQNHYITVFKTHKGFSSDYRLAQHWQVEQSRIRQYRDDRLRLPLVFVLDIAYTIGAEPIEIIAALEYKRAREQDKEILLNVYFASARKTIGARMSRDCRGSWHRHR